MIDTKAMQCDLGKKKKSWEKKIWHLLAQSYGNTIKLHLRMSTITVLRPPFPIRGEFVMIPGELIHVVLYYII